MTTRVQAEIILTHPPNWIAPMFPLPAPRNLHTHNMPFSKNKKTDTEWKRKKSRGGDFWGFWTIYFSEWESIYKQRWSRPPLLLQLQERSKKKKKKRQEMKNTLKFEKITDLFLNVYFTWYQSRARSSRFIYIFHQFEVTWSREDTKCTILLEWQSIREKGSREREQR